MLFIFRFDDNSDGELDVDELMKLVNNLGVSAKKEVRKEAKKEVVPAKLRHNTLNDFSYSKITDKMYSAIIYTYTGYMCCNFVILQIQCIDYR